MRGEFLDSSTGDVMIRFSGRPEEVALAMSLFTRFASSTAESFDTTAMMAGLEKQLTDFLSRSTEEPSEQ